MNITNETLSAVSVFVTTLDSYAPLHKSQTVQLDMMNAGVLKLLSCRRVQYQYMKSCLSIYELQFMTTRKDIIDHQLTVPVPSNNNQR